VNQRLHVLHVQKLFWKPYGKNAIFWAFHVIYDNTQVDGKVLQVICHRKYVLFIAKTKLKKGIISYFKSN